MGCGASINAAQAQRLDQLEAALTQSIARLAAAEQQLSKYAAVSAQAQPTSGGKSSAPTSGSGGHPFGGEESSAQRMNAQQLGIAAAQRTRSRAASGSACGWSQPSKAMRLHHRPLMHSLLLCRAKPRSYARSTLSCRHLLPRSTSLLVQLRFKQRQRPSRLHRLCP